MGCCNNQATKATEHRHWDKGATERINRLRNQYWANQPEIDVERAVIYTRVYQQSASDEPAIRHAKALLAYMSEKTLTIGKDELIIGTEGRKSRSAVICPEICCRWAEEELDTMSTRPQDPYLISEESKRLLKDVVFPYWRGRSMEDYFLDNMSDELKNIGMGTNIVFSDAKSATGGGEWSVGYHNIVMKKGFKGVRQDAEARLAALDLTDSTAWDQATFYKAVILTCEACRVMCQRYADYARQLASTESNPARKDELLQIAENCRAPYEAPRNFREAVQSVWFTQMMIWADENQQACCIGRPDQYLYPFYKADMEHGALTKLQAQELLECLWIKLAEYIYVVTAEAASIFSGYISYCGVTIGGVDDNGENAVNELSSMMLQCTADLQMNNPTLNVRVNQKTPDSYLMEVVDLIRLGTGQPAVFFDETAFRILENHGIPLKEAYNWGVGGCIEPHLPGKYHMWSEGCRYSFPIAVEWALFNGYTHYWKRDIGVKTGDPRTFDTYEKFENAVKTQLAYEIKNCVESVHLAERAHKKRLPKTVRSILTEGCVESGKDCIMGGALFNNGPGIETTGVADLADSMAAVKKLVYEERVFTMDQLVSMLDKNFEGYETQRQILIDRAPKYGNGDAYVDDIAKEMMDFVAAITGFYKNALGYHFNTGNVPATANVPHGEVTWALPSGRKAGTPLADGISPYTGYDKNGPTSILRSVCKLDVTKVACGNLLNMKFSPALLNSEQDKRNFIAMLRTEGRLGGYHVQFNVVSNETLKDAQKHPENYGDLLVRVAGYSAYFVDLRPDVQQAIIDRTELSAW